MRAIPFAVLNSGYSVSIIKFRIKLKPMNHYKDYSAADFALDESFQKWVLNPDQETVHFWKNIIENYPYKRNEIDEAIQLVRLSGLSTDQEANTAYLGVWKNVSEIAERDLAGRARTKFPRYIPLAAAVIAMLIVVAYFLRNRDEKVLEYKTSFAEVKEVRLDDGSTVTLNSNSSLTLSESWITKNEREVFLQGEAYFNVVKTPDHQVFRVKIPGGIVIQVLGTTFNVNTRRETPSVYLQSGKVRLHVAGDSLTLQPGERADYQKTLQKMVISQESQDDANDKLAWRNNLYVMNDFSLLTIARDMEDNFGKEVIIMDSALTTKSVTAKVPASDINVWLKVLSETLDIEIEQRNNKIIINPRR